MSKNNLIPILSSNTGSNGVCLSTSEYLSYSAWRAFNGNYTGNDCWIPSISSSSNVWIYYKFNQQQLVNGYVIYPREDNIVISPKDWIFQGSNDGNTWTVLDTQANITNWTASVGNKYVFKNLNQYYYYRLYVNAGNNPSMVAIGELQMFSFTTKYLIQDKLNNLLKVSNGSIINLGQVSATEQLFLSDGMDTVPSLTDSILAQIGSCKILKWTDSGLANQTIVCQGDYRDKIINLISNWGLKMWTNDMTITSPKINHTTTPYKPISKLGDTFDIKYFMPFNTNRFDFSFNSSDKTNYTISPTPTNVIFDGSMRLLDITLNTNSSDTGFLVSSELFTSDLIDTSKFNSIETINITDGVTPTETVNGVCPPNKIVDNTDMSLDANILDISQIVWNSTTSGNGVLKLAISVDQGTTWQAYNGATWVTIDMNGLADFKAKGMDSSIVNALTSAQLESLRGSSKTVRFAYYLEKVNIADVASSDSITLKIEVKA